MNNAQTGMSDKLLGPVPLFLTAMAMGSLAMHLGVIGAALGG